MEPQLIEQPELMQVKLELKIVSAQNSYRSSNGQINEHINEHIKLSERQFRIIGYIAENPTITLSELAAKEDVAKITIRRDLDVLQKEGIILRQGSTRAGRWDILKH